MKAELAGVETLGRAEVHGAAQAAVQGVAPAVVAAGELTAAVAPAVGGQRTGAVAADIVEAAQGPVGAAHRQDRPAGHLASHVVAGRRRLVFVTQELPAGGEHALALAGVGGGVAVEAGGKRALHGAKLGRKAGVASTGEVDEEDHRQFHRSDLSSG